MGFLSNKIDRKQLKAGDHIYSWRQGYLYAHHGIYVGEGMVIHFTNGAIQQTETPTISKGFFASSAPSFRSSAPSFTSSGPSFTSSAPSFKSSAPSFTSSAPSFRSSAPSLKSSAPSFKSSAPSFTSSGPSFKSSAPSFKSSVPSLDTDIPCPKCGDCCQTGTDGVISSCLDCFLSGGGLYLFQYGVSKLCFIAQARGGTCTLASSDPTEEVLRRALYLLENGFVDYHFFKNNCEDFAIFCKTGFLSSVGGSGQAASYSAGAISLTSTVLGFVAPISVPLVGSVTYCYKRLVYDIGYRSSGETKVAVEEIPKMKSRGKINMIVPCVEYVESRCGVFLF